MLPTFASLLVLVTAAPDGPVFDRDVAPLLIEKCLDCHSGARPKGQLDLTSKRGTRSQLVPGKPHQSPLYEKIATHEMPPKKPLTDPQKKVIFDWIARGAEWGTDPIDPFRVSTSKRAGFDWWSLQPISRPELPKVSDPSAVPHPIDRFLVARLESAGLKLSPEADRRTLLRRLHFDLIGLPPSAEEVAAFVADPSPKAYEKWVDQLLASPHYGERWARHWLDVVRFGESDGFERNAPRPHAWPYRNWVIQALNEDLPYDEFVRRQLAGDVLRPNDPAAHVATGYLVAGVHNTVVPIMAAAQATAFQDELEDLVGNVGQTFLGLTTNCARCHDHKFDPISTRDYYRLAATLAGVRPGERPLPNPAVAEELARVQRDRAGVQRERRQLEGPTRPLLHWDFRQGSEGLTLSEGTKWTCEGLVFDGKSYARSAPLTQDIREKTLDVWVQLANRDQRGAGVMTIETPDGAVFDSIVFGEREPQRWMAGSNNFVRTQSFAAPAETETNRTVRVTIVYAANGTITGYRDGKPYGQSYTSTGPVLFPAGKAVLTFGLRHFPAAGNRHLSGRIEQARLYDRALSAEEIAADTKLVEPKLAAADQARLATLRTQEEMLSKRIRELEARQAFKLYTALSGPPGPARVLIRGQASDPGETVTPGGLAALGVGRADWKQTDQTPEGDRRRALAEWVTHPQNPLLARVIVNRVWHYHFGIGIVETPNDFGFNGGRPSHPELLDWLAHELATGGGAGPAAAWRLKRLHKLIVTSAAYRQSSSPRPEALTRDAESRLVWRKRPLRLDGEAVRDGMLTVTGLLNREVGGKGFIDYAISDAKAGTTFYDPIDPIGSEFHRRSIYRFLPRAANPGLLDAFDCPDPAAASPRRNSTTTPLQALALLNGSFTLRMADALADRMGPGSPEDQVSRAYRFVFQRDPEPAESTAATKLVREHGLKALARALFNTNEFLTAE